MTVAPGGTGSRPPPENPLRPPSGDSMWTVPSSVRACSSTQVRLSSASSGMWFSSLQASTHRPQPMHVVVSITNAHSCAEGSYAGPLGAGSTARASSVGAPMTAESSRAPHSAGTAASPTCSMRRRDSVTPPAACSSVPVTPVLLMGRSYSSVAGR